MPVYRFGELTIEWDEAKARSNEAKHGIVFEEASTVIRDPLAGTVYDRSGSPGEDRIVTIGSVSRGRLLVVTHTDRGDRVRIIGARPATRAERRTYEDDKPQE